MQTFKQIAQLREQVQAWKMQGLRIAFVPTMGNLHQGHLSLVEKAQASADKVIASIFVNPLQFGPNEDFDSYPRTFAADEAKLQSVNCDAVFYPTVVEMYPNGRNQTIVSVPESLTGLLEGTSRPGHFDGVTTVVCKLFNMVQPDVAVFGQKDFQQLRVIEKMVEELNLPVEIQAAAIARDSDGLALSSRNQYLNESQRSIAPKLFVTLQDIALAIESGNLEYSSLIEAASKQLIQIGFDEVDYIKVVHSKTLIELENGQNLPGLAILAVAKLGKTRLLDNILLN